MRRIERMASNPLEAQYDALTEVLRLGEMSDFGRRYEVERIETIEDFQSQVPLSDYSSMGGYLRQMLDGEADVTTEGRVRLFARSTDAEPLRKYIPITHHSLWGNHLRGARDMVALYMDAHPSSHILDGRCLTGSGWCSRVGRALVGDLSALLIHQTRFMSGWLRVPRTQTALIADFDKKVERIYRECRNEDISVIAGSPSLSLALMRRVLELSGKRDLREVWSGLELMTHSGVGFTPHRSAFAEIFPHGDIRYMESYITPEGFFAIADNPSREDMLLMLDYGTFYEFRSGDNIVPLEGVATGVPYAMIITSTNGLWRYEIGDIVEFTSTAPYRLRIVERTNRESKSDKRED
ncbi:MAG: GH3 auxin-responsive promoter family protein [Alistipes sp.]|nr:GH3 auxin-responsive promoter family protein [Alistipes sp.]